MRYKNKTALEAVPDEGRVLGMPGPVGTSAENAAGEVPGAKRSRDMTCAELHRKELHATSIIDVQICFIIFNLGITSAEGGESYVEKKA